MEALLNTEQSSHYHHEQSSQTFRQTNFLLGSCSVQRHVYLAEGMMSNHGVSLGGVGACRSGARREGRLLLQPLFDLLTWRHMHI